MNIFRTLLILSWCRHAAALAQSSFHTQHQKSLLAQARVEPKVRGKMAAAMDEDGNIEFKSGEKTQRSRAQGLSHATGNMAVSMDEEGNIDFSGFQASKLAEKTRCSWKKPPQWASRVDRTSGTNWHEDETNWKLWAWATAQSGAGAGKIAGHNILRKSEIGIGECQEECEAEQRCKSINFEPRDYFGPGYWPVKNYNLRKGTCTLGNCQIGEDGCEIDHDTNYLYFACENDNDIGGDDGEAPPPTDGGDDDDDGEAPPPTDGGEDDDDQCSVDWKGRTVGTPGSGCQSATYKKTGKPSKKYCKGNKGSEKNRPRFEWYQRCCQWNEVEGCVPKRGPVE